MNSSACYCKTFNRIFQISEKSIYFLKALKQLRHRIGSKDAEKLRLVSRFERQHYFVNELVREHLQFKAAKNYSECLCRPPAVHWIDSKRLSKAKSTYEVEMLLKQAEVNQLNHYVHVIASINLPNKLAYILNEQKVKLQEAMNPFLQELDFERRKKYTQNSKAI